MMITQTPVKSPSREIDCFRVLVHIHSKKDCERGFYDSRYHIAQWLIMPVRFEAPKGKFKNCTLLAGFHGIGETGYIAVSYIVNALKAKRVGFIRTTNSPAFVTTTREGLLTPFEIYRKRNLVMAKLEFPPHRNEEADIARTMAAWAVEEDFKETLLLGGLDVGFKNGRCESRVVPTRAYLEESKKLGIPLLERGLYVFGPLAIMLAEFEVSNFPAVAILPYADSSRSDPRAASIAVRTVARVCKLNINVADLENYAKVIEADLDQRAKIATKSVQGLYV